MPEPFYAEPLATIYHGDCREVMATMPEAPVDAIVTDPPYGLEFMGKEWDKLARPKPGNIGGFADGNKPSFERVKRYLPAMQSWHTEWAAAALRVAKPGAHLLAFGGTRTHHRLTVALEDAGWEIRDCLMWLYGSGFPKSKNLGTGWGTALKPAWEPIILARKPLIGTVAENVQRHGTGAINVDGCRVETDWSTDPTRRGWQGGHSDKPEHLYSPGPRDGKVRPRSFTPETAPGRWPANLVIDEAAAAMLDEQSGQLTSGKLQTHHKRSGQAQLGTFNIRDRTGEPCDFGGDSGGASRFFYTAKADREDRDGSKHPTVKPLDLMKWLVRLVTPPEGIVLDPFLGSGTTVAAARALGIRSIGIEQDATHCAEARHRLRQGALL